jgi:hypothetical protein
MRGWRIYTLAAAMLMSSTAMAATELHGGPGFSALGVDASAVESRPAAVDGAAANDFPFSVDEAILNSAGASPSVPKANPFSWTFILIAFAGLTAVFAGKRSGGRGLIGV